MSEARTVVFVDARVPNYQSLVAGIAANVDVVILASDSNGVAQIAAHLAGRTNLDGVHIVSHGSAGALYLGNVALTTDNLAAHADALAAIGAALSETGDMLLYGCDVAAGDAGAEFIERLSALTGADVAASTDRTGAGGDWDLERTTGEINEHIAFSEDARAAWNGTLVPLTFAVDTTTATSATYTAPETNDPGTFGDDLTIDAGITVAVTGAGNFLTLQAGDDIILQTGSAATADGNVTLTAGFGDLDSHGGIDVDGAVTAGAASSATLAAVDLITLGANAAVNGPGGVTLRGHNMTIGGTVNAGTSTAVLGTAVGDSSIVRLGGVDAAEVLNLTDTEIDLVTAGTVRIEGQGNIQVAAPISPANTNHLELYTSNGSIADLNSSGADITVTRLALSMTTGMTTGNILETSISSFEGVTGTGNIGVINDQALTIGGVNGTLTGVSVLTAGDISLASTAAVTVSEGVSTASGSIAIEGSAISDGTGSEQPDVSAQSLALRAVSGIGSADDLDIAVSNLAFSNTTSGNVNISNSGALTIGSVDSLATSSNSGGGTTTITASSPLTFAVDTTSAGTATYTAGDVDDRVGEVFADDLTINAGVTVSVTGTNNDLFLRAGDEIVLAGSASAADLLSLQAGFNDADGSSYILQTGVGSLAAPLITLEAINGIGADGAPILVSGATRLEAQTYNGGIFINADSSVSVGVSGGTFNGIQTLNPNGDGDISVTAAGSIVLDGNDFDDIRALDGDVTVHATGNTANVEVRNASGDAIDADAGNITVTAGQDILVGGGTIGTHAGIDANGNITLSAGRDVTVHQSSYAQATGAGTIGVTAGRDVSLVSSGQLQTQGGAITVTTGAGGLFSQDTVSAVPTINTTLAGGNGAVTIDADRADFGRGVNAGSGIASIRGASASRAIDLGSTTDAATGTLELSDAELDRVTTSLLRVGSAQSGSITVTAAIAVANTDTLSLQTGNAIVDGTGTEQADVTETRLVLRAVNGIGAADDLDIAAGFLAFSNTTGGNVNISSTGALGIQAWDDVTTSSNVGGGTTTITASSPLTVNMDMSSGGTLTLTASDSAAAGDDLTINTSWTVESTDGDVVLNAGDNLVLGSNVTIDAAGALQVFVDAGDADPGTGGTANLSQTTINAASITITGAGDADTLTGSSLADSITGGGGMDTVNAGDGDDDLYVAAGHVLAGETYNGGLGTDALYVSGVNNFTGTTIQSIEAVEFGFVVATSSATFTSNQLGGAGLSSTLAVEGDADTNQIIVDIVSPANTVDLSGWTFTDWTPGTDTIAVNGSADADTITGSSQNEQVTGNAGSDSFTYSVGSGSDTFDGGGDTDTLTVNGTPGQHTYDLRPITIAAATYLGINIDAGATAAAADNTNYEVATKDVENVVINTNGGGDNVVITGDLTGTGVAAGTITLNGDADANTFDASGLTSAHKVVMNGAGGADTLTGGAGNDTLTGGAGSDAIDSGAGNDTINYTAGDGADSIDGGADNDTLAIGGTGGNDTISVLVNASGIVTQLAGGSVANVESVTLDLGGGSDTLDYGSTALDLGVYLDAGQANGFTSVADVENVIGGSGDDTFFGTLEANAFSGSGGDDLVFYQDPALFGSAGGLDTFDGGSGTDTEWVSGFPASQTYNVNPISLGGVSWLGFNVVAGANSIAAATDANSEIATKDVEKIRIDLGNNGNRVVLSGDLASTGVAASTVTVNGGTDIDVVDASGLTGTPVSLVLSGGGGNDVLSGGAGADTINGGDGDDTITGGAGADALSGGDGQDVFLIASPADHPGGETIDGDASDGDLDVIRFTSTTANDTLILSAGVTSITWASISDAAGDRSGTTALNLDASATFVVLLEGNAGDNTLTGGDGFTQLDGGAGIDTLHGGGGDDRLVVTSNGDAVAGETYDGGEGSGDTLSVFQYSALPITASFAGSTLTSLEKLDLSAASATFESSQIGGGGLSASTSVTAYGGGVTDSITVNMVSPFALNLSGWTFTDWAGEDTITIAGSASADTVTGSSQNDTFNGNAGNDSYTYTVGNGQDQFQGGGDTDTLTVNGTSAQHTYDIRAIDVATTNSLGINIQAGSTAGAADNANYEVKAKGVENLVINTNGGGDNVVISGSLTGTGLSTSTITLNGDADANAFVASPLVSAHNVVMTGAGGADTLLGGAGDDVFIIAAGADHPLAEVIDGGTGTDVIRFTSTIASDTLTLSEFVTNVDEARISNAAGLTTGTTALNLNAAALLAAGIALVGNAGANTLTGSDFEDSLTGGAGQDSIIGGAGDDTLFAAAGEVVVGEIYDGGDDTDILGVAGTIDFTGTTLLSLERLQTVTPGASSVTYTSTQVGGANLSSTLQVEASPGANAIVVNVVSPANTLDLSGWTFDSWDAGTDTITINGSADADTITGSSENDLVFGNGGNDSFTHNVDAGGQDIFDGGANTDTLTVNGTGAQHTFAINAITLSGVPYLGINIVGGATAVDADNTNYEVATRNLENVVINVNGGVDIFVATGDLSGTGVTTVTVNGAGDPEDFDASGVTSTTAFVMNGGAGTDELTGGAGNDTLNGGADGDNMSGGDGDDVIIIASAAEHASDLTINGGAGTNDVIRFTASTTQTLALHDVTKWDPLESTCRHASLSIL